MLPLIRTTSFVAPNTILNDKSTSCKREAVPFRSTPAKLGISRESSEATRLSRRKTCTQAASGKQHAMGEPRKPLAEPTVLNYRRGFTMPRGIDTCQGSFEERPSVRNRINEFGNTALDQAFSIPIEETREAWVLARPRGASGEPLSVHPPRSLPKKWACAPESARKEAGQGLEEAYRTPTE